MTSPQEPMRHTVRMGMVCAALAALMVPLGIGIGIGAIFADAQPKHCATAGR